jgi:hypothetical protein
MRKRFYSIAFLMAMFLMLLVTGCNLIPDAGNSDNSLITGVSPSRPAAMPKYTKVLIRNKWSTPRNVTEYLRCYPDPLNVNRNTIGCVPYNANERDYYVWSMVEYDNGTVAFQNVATDGVLLDSESVIMTAPPVKWWHVPLGMGWQWLTSHPSLKLKYIWKRIPTSDGYSRLQLSDSNYFLNTEIQIYSNFIKETYLTENAPQDWWSAQWAFDSAE